jgi:hypothetical protein
VAEMMEAGKCNASFLDPRLIVIMLMFQHLPILVGLL